MNQKSKNQKTSEKNQISYAKEAWEGGAIALLTFVFPLIIGIIDLILGLSRIPLLFEIMILIGIIIFIIGTIPFILSFRIISKQPTKLIKNGIYVHMRHPHYFSNIMHGLSFIFFFRSWWSLLVFSISLPIIYYLIRREEKKLILKYGEEYNQYKKQVPMLFPKIFRK